MLRIHAIYFLTTLLLLAAAPSLALVPSNEILSPVSGSPVAVAPGGVFDLRMQMAVPLTPPPGVQLEKVWVEWAVFLTRAASFALPPAKPLIRHRGRIVRISSDNGEDVYIIEVQVSPWTPEGVYTLSIEGPGFKKDSKASVKVGSAGGTAISPGVPFSNDKWRFHNRQTTPWRGTIDVVVPGGNGVEMTDSSGRRLPLIGAVFATCMRSCSAAEDRLLRFEATVPAASVAHGPESIAKEGVLVIRVRKIGPLSATPRVAISLTSSTRRLDPLVEHGLTAMSSFKQVSVLWDFNDGHVGMGPRVTHRWTRSLSMTAVTHVFDSEGRVFSSEFNQRLEIPLNREGCNCLIGAKLPNLHSLLKVVLFSCIDSWILE